MSQRDTTQRWPLGANLIRLANRVRMTSCNGVPWRPVADQAVRAPVRQKGNDAARGREKITSDYTRLHGAVMMRMGDGRAIWPELRQINSVRGQSDSDAA